MPGEIIFEYRNFCITMICLSVILNHDGCSYDVTFNWQKSEQVYITRDAMSPGYLFLRLPTCWCV